MRVKPNHHPHQSLRGGHSPRTTLIHKAMALSVKNLFKSQKETLRVAVTIMNIRPLIRDGARVEGNSVIDIVDEDGEQLSPIVFDNVFDGRKPVVPANGLPAVLTIVESTAVDAEGNHYTNVVGVQIDVEKLSPVMQMAALGIAMQLPSMK